MIQIEPCKGCTGLVIVDQVANFKIKCDSASLDGQGAVDALLDGRELWRVRYLSGRPSTLSAARPDVLSALATAEPAERPVVVRQHRCDEATRARLTASQGVAGPGGRSDSPKARVAPSSPSSGSKEATGTVPDVDSQSSKPVGDDASERPEATIDLGELVTWARRLEEEQA
jgi:hypothetical protein